MNKTEFLDIFATFTTEDWQTFNTFRIPKVEPISLEVIQAQRLELVAEKLARLGITRPETVTKDFILFLLDKLDAKQFVGEGVSEWVDAQEVLFGSLENAFDGLVIKYL